MPNWVCFAKINHELTRINTRWKVKWNWLCFFNWTADKRDFWGFWHRLMCFFECFWKILTFFSIFCRRERRVRPQSSLPHPFYDIRHTIHEIRIWIRRARGERWEDWSCLSNISWLWTLLLCVLGGPGGKTEIGFVFSNETTWPCHARGQWTQINRFCRFLTSFAPILAVFGRFWHF